MLNDLPFALRQMRRHPGIYLVVLIALAVGIGANTAVFTLVNAVLLRGLPFEDGERILHLENNNLVRGWNSIEVSYPDFEDWRKANDSFESLAAYDGYSVNLSDASDLPDRLSGCRISGGFFQLIGQHPVLGRDFSADDTAPGGAGVVILSHALWQSRFGQAADILERSVRINGVPHQVIGVMAEEMAFPGNTDLWLPLRREGNLVERDARRLEVIGKLRKGLGLKQVRAEMDVIARQLQEQYPDTNQDLGIEVKAYSDEVNGGEIRTVFLALLGAVGFVLLIVCANVANLILVRTTSRRHEISVRAALGASRRRVLRQLLSEAVLLGLTGGIAGLGLAWFGVQLFDRAVANVGKPAWIRFDLDLTVFAYFFGVCIVAGVLSGLAPALQASRVDLNETLKEAGGRTGSGVQSHTLTKALVVAQLAISLLLLVGAGLMIRSLLNVALIDIGVPVDDLVMMRLVLDESRYPDEESLVRFHERLRERLGGLSGIRSAAVTSHRPMEGGSRVPLIFETLPQTIYDASWPFRVFGSIFTILALVALFLSSIGLYTVISHSVTGRIHDTGVKIALGASGRQILFPFLRQGLAQLVVGLFLGLLGAFAVSRVMAPLLIRISPSDPVTFVTVALVLSAVALIACYLPAKRATRIDPVIALRRE